ncbi:hypothetical protein KP509_25G059900 [Ceratopteris richardii]|uniref:Uncharacterized protein n=1 Tax=Ceratopteris richardii TaxID=49495 RepID=A0A8T2RTC1_CERRI|nr:hypothetical protein KP509_25G059900 [Ceratopteris richardii]
MCTRVYLRGVPIRAPCINVRVERMEKCDNHEILDAHPFGLWSSTLQKICVGAKHKFNHEIYIFN